MKSVLWYMIGLGMGALGVSQLSLVQRAQPLITSAEPGETLVIAHADSSFAKEVCERRHLTWSALRLSADGTRIEVICESEEIVRGQIRAHWEAIKAGRN